MVELAAAVPASATLDVRPPAFRSGEALEVTFHPLRIPGATSVQRYDVAVFDRLQSRVATLLDEPARPWEGLVRVDWDGRDDGGRPLAPGSYVLRVICVGTDLQLERALLVRG